jgi:hypothetical protein
MERLDPAFNRTSLELKRSERDDRQYPSQRRTATA